MRFYQVTKLYQNYHFSCNIHCLWNPVAVGFVHPERVSFHGNAVTGDLVFIEIISVTDKARPALFQFQSLFLCVICLLQFLLKWCLMWHSNKMIITLQQQSPLSTNGE